MNYPFGIADIHSRKMIDLDEALRNIDGINRTCGTCLIGDRAREVGPYSKSEKVTLLLVVTGDALNLDRWYNTWRVDRTTII